MQAIVVAILLGACLAGAAGFRAFLPLFFLGVTYRLHTEYGMPLGPWLPDSPSIAWVTSDAAILCFGLATVFEVLADKVPGFDHTLDAVLSVARPGSGAVSVFALLNGQDPVVSYTLAIVVGTTVTVPVQLLKGGARLAANTATLGAAAPVVSVLEDLGAFTLVLLIVAPLVAVLCGLILVWAVRRLRRRQQRSNLRTNDPVDSPS